MPDRRPKRLDRMARQITPRHIGDRHRHHQRYIAATSRCRFIRRHRRAFGIERVKDCLDEQKINATFNQRIALFAVHIL